MNETKTKTAVFGGGCFWCTEAVFRRLKGVESVVSGYSGGDMDEATYEEVSSGGTSHAEVIKVDYNESVITYSDLLQVFFASHDPTTLNRQGNDNGPQYRSVIFYADDQQKIDALKYIKHLTDEKVFEDPIVTEVRPMLRFYSAEEYHQGYYDNNSSNPYCAVVINPKVAKLREKFSHLIKDV